MSNSTSDYIAPLISEVSSIDYQWAALEALSDILCVSMALYVGLNGAKKLWPYHDGYAGTKKGFYWLASIWGVRAYPHLFRSVIGIVEVSVFIGCMCCFIPSAVFQLVTCIALVMGMSLCVAFFITHTNDPWSKRGPQLWQFAQASLALAIRLYQDFPSDNHQMVITFKVSCVLIFVGLVFMIYRRVRYGRVPDPLLG